jgi:hypothetical protein
MYRVAINFKKKMAVKSNIARIAFKAQDISAPTLS